MMSPISPEEFLRHEWYLRFSSASGEWILGQPSSSILVFLLSFLAIQYGITFLRSQREQKSRFWCGVALILSGIGSTAAGIYYQAFGYQIRCLNSSVCASTSLWESLYLSLSSFGVMAFLFAVGHGCVVPKRRSRIFYYAIGNTIVYQLLLLIGILRKDAFLVSYNFSILFTGASIFLLSLVNCVDYLKNQNALSGILLRSYGILVCTSLSYFIYYQLQITEWLWQRNIWFSQNDVLHIGMIFWVYYVAKNLHPSLKDKIPSM